jgi:hypothetical protein
MRAASQFAVSTEVLLRCPILTYFAPPTRGRHFQPARLSNCAKSLHQSSAVLTRLLVFTTRRSVCGRSRAKPEQSCCSLPMFRSICGLGGAELLAKALANLAKYVVELRSACRVIEHVFSNQELYVSKKPRKIVRREYSKADVKELRAHSKARTPLDKIVKRTKRTEGSLRQKALKLGIGLGHQR